MTLEIRRARSAFWRVGLVIPLAALALSTTVIATWMPQLPDPVATHWSATGPDEFGPRWTVLLTPLVGAGLIAALAVTALLAHRLPSSSKPGRVVLDERGVPQWSATARLLGAMNLGIGLFMGMLSLAVAGVQRGLVDAADAPSITPMVLGGLAVMVAGAAVGWFLQPSVASLRPAVTAAAAVPIGATERAAWFGTVSISRSGRVVLGSSLAVLALTTAVAFAADAIGGWISLGTLVLLLALFATCLAFQVSVSSEGLQVRSVAGWPQRRIPLAEIEQVGVVQVDPFGEFGGWGWRVGMDGRRGVVMRKGEALQVRANGRVFVVTVDGADEAAAVLEGLRNT